MKNNFKAEVFKNPLLVIILLLLIIIAILIYHFKITSNRKSVLEKFEGITSGPQQICTKAFIDSNDVRFECNKNNGKYKVTATGNCPLNFIRNGKNSNHCNPPLSNVGSGSSVSAAQPATSTDGPGAS